MLLHVVQGKGRKHRLVPLSPVLLHHLRCHYQRYRPRHWLFPSRIYPDRHVTRDAVALPIAKVRHRSPASPCPRIPYVTVSLLKYLARYTHRFRYQGYVRGHRHRMMKLDAVEFLRRFLQHVLPDRFVRIRHYGFLANRARKEKLPLCRRLIARVTGNDMIAAPAVEACLQAPAAAGARSCPACHEVTMRRIQEFRSQPTWEYRPLRRGPPDTA